MVAGLHLKLTVQFSKGAREDLAHAPEIMAEELRRGLNEALLILESAAKKQITRIGLIDTGRLRSSIHSEVLRVDAAGFSGVVQTGSEVVYARIHEYGGTIVPKTAKVLAWVDKGILRPAPDDKERWKALRAVGAAHYARQVTVRAKHYMRDALENARPDIRRVIRRAARQGLTRIIYEKELY